MRLPGQPYPPPWESAQADRARAGQHEHQAAHVPGVVPSRVGDLLGGQQLVGHEAAPS